MLLTTAMLRSLYSTFIVDDLQSVPVNNEDTTSGNNAQMIDVETSTGVMDNDQRCATNNCGRDNNEDQTGSTGGGTNDQSSNIAVVVEFQPDVENNIGTSISAGEVSIEPFLHRHDPWSFNEIVADDSSFDYFVVPDNPSNNHMEENVTDDDTSEAILFDPTPVVLVAPQENVLSQEILGAGNVIDHVARSQQEPGENVAGNEDVSDELANHTVLEENTTYSEASVTLRPEENVADHEVIAVIFDQQQEPEENLFGQNNSLVDVSPNNQEENAMDHHNVSVFDFGSLLTSTNSTTVYGSRSYPSKRKQHDSSSVAQEESDGDHNLDALTRMFKKHVTMNDISVGSVTGIKAIKRIVQECIESIPLMPKDKKIKPTTNSNDAKEE